MASFTQFMFKFVLFLFPFFLFSFLLKICIKKCAALVFKKSWRDGKDAIITLFYNNANIVYE